MPNSSENKFTSLQFPAIQKGCHDPNKWQIFFSAIIREKERGKEGEKKKEIFALGTKKNSRSIQRAKTRRTVTKRKKKNDRR